MDTIFTKIINREIPADIVYEDEVVLAFLDINPNNHGHTLVVPKEHSVDATQTDAKTLTHILSVGQRVALAQRELLHATGNNFIFNCGADGGQEVFHTHLHVVPRFKNDGVFEPPRHTSYKEGESAAVAQKIKEHLQ